ncbi:hypothetical protein CFOL_v3_30536, partial [Cephalotus follicularis]
RRDETLREYLNRFNAEALKVRDLVHSIAVTMIINGLRDCMFTHSLTKNNQKELSEHLERAEKYINAEEAITAKKTADELKTRKRKKRDDYGRCEEDNRDRKRKNRSSRRYDILDSER